ncbi:preprotein translocase subunit SecE [uncultured Desulfuromonas sp.]|uniref:preprotein translocase subunit SecE n=1 Tax=uncultured Desulfuromonas sp. TaxID=181013 RepID=UPI002AAA62AD|nr:preprotein translocase subunit SecE [uncultured Desulfuromonas sp.]
MIAKVSGFLGNVKSELTKVTWPTWKDTYGSTMVVIAFVLLVAVFLWGVDNVLSVLVKNLLS